MIDTQSWGEFGAEHDDIPSAVLYGDLTGVLGPIMCLGHEELVGEIAQPDRKA